MKEPSEYVLEPIRHGADFTLCRGRRHGNPASVLAIALFAEQPLPQTLRVLRVSFACDGIGLHEADPAGRSCSDNPTRDSCHDIGCPWNPLFTFVESIPAGGHCFQVLRHRRSNPRGSRCRWSHARDHDAVEFPLEIRVTSTSDVNPIDEPADNRILLKFGEKASAILRNVPGVARTQTDWLNEAPQLKLNIDPDRANFAGLGDADIARTAQTAANDRCLRTRAAE